MTSLAPIFFSERLSEYQNTIAQSDPKYNEKLKEKELDDNYKEQMMEGCRVFAKELEKINEKKFFLTTGNQLKHHISGAENYTYFYTGCPELKKFISQFNSRDNNNQIKINEDDKFVNKILVNQEDVKNGQLHYELNYELNYELSYEVKDEYKSEYSRLKYDKIPQPPSKDNVFFG